jgi:putative restriction endonuclease
LVIERGTSTSGLFSAIISAMDENRTGYSFKALDRQGSGSSLRLPGREPFPPLDEHLVEPEVTRDEIIGGRRVVAMPALEPHADQQSDLDYALRAHVAPGYRTAADLLTRHDVDSDFASDACVYRKGVDPETGKRYLEEIAFEIVSEQNQRDVTEKAVHMHRRGVRRIFAIMVKGERRVCEWSPESQSWRPLEADAQIEDPSLVKPLAVAALLDAAVADNEVVEALAAKDNPALRRREDAAEVRGEAKALLKILDARGIAISETQRQEILRCRDLDQLDRWLVRAVQASSIDEITSEP